MNNPPDIIQNHYAFPNGQGDEGMTLRDYFLAATATGILANPAWANMPADEVACEAMLQAQALLKAREQ